MRRLTMVLCLFLALPLFAGVSHADVYNVAQGADVTLIATGGSTFFTGGWGAGAVVGAETVTDGLFLPRSNQWDQGAVWWDANGTLQGQQGIRIDLGGSFLIESLVVQADDNDGYLLYSGTNGNGGSLLWDIPVVGGWGMQTRPNPGSDDERYLLLGAPVVADWLFIVGNNANSDLLFSVSEVQAYGTAAPVPEPSSVILLGSALTGLAGAARRRIRK